MALLALPLDALQHCLSYLTRIGDIARACRVCRRLRDATYVSITHLRVSGGQLSPTRISFLRPIVCMVNLEVLDFNPPMAIDKAILISDVPRLVALPKLRSVKLYDDKLLLLFVRSLERGWAGKILPDDFELVFKTTRLILSYRRGHLSLISPPGDRSKPNLLLSIMFMSLVERVEVKSAETSICEIVATTAALRLEDRKFTLFIPGCPRGMNYEREYLQEIAIGARSLPEGRRIQTVAYYRDEDREFPGLLPGPFQGTTTFVGSILLGDLRRCLGIFPLATQYHVKLRCSDSNVTMLCGTALTRRPTLTLKLEFPDFDLLSAEPETLYTYRRILAEAWSGLLRDFPGRVSYVLPQKPLANNEAILCQLAGLLLLTNQKLNARRPTPEPEMLDPEDLSELF